MSQIPTKVCRGLKIFAKGQDFWSISRSESLIVNFNYKTISARKKPSENQWKRGSAVDSFHCSSRLGHSVLTVQCARYELNWAESIDSIKKSFADETMREERNVQRLSWKILMKEKQKVCTSVSWFVHKNATIAIKESNKYLKLSDFRCRPASSSKMVTINAVFNVAPIPASRQLPIASGLLYSEFPSVRHMRVSSSCEDNLPSTRKKSASCLIHRMNDCLDLVIMSHAQSGSPECSPEALRRTFRVHEF